MTFFSRPQIIFKPFITEKRQFIPPKIYEIMILCIGCADYSYQYRLQPIVLIGPITRMVVILVQL